MQFLLWPDWLYLIESQDALHIRVFFKHFLRIFLTKHEMLMKTVLSKRIALSLSISSVYRPGHCTFPDSAFAISHAAISITQEDEDV